MIINDFIFAFNKAWKEVNKDKIRSKKQIKEIKILVNEWKERTDDIKRVGNILSRHWKYFPVQQRKDFIQKTFDLIQYGFEIKYKEDGTYIYNYGDCDNGLIKLYNYIYNIVLNDFVDMKDYYHQKNYIMVNHIYENCIKRINEELKSYNITQKYETNE